MSSSCKCRPAMLAGFHQFSQMVYAAVNEQGSIPDCSQVTVNAAYCKNGPVLVAAFKDAPAAPGVVCFS